MLFRSPSGIELLREALGQFDERSGTAKQAAWHLSSRDLSIESEPQEGAQPELLMHLANVELLSSPQESQSHYLLRMQFAEAAEIRDYPVELRISRNVPGGQQKVFLRVIELTPAWLLATLGCFPSDWGGALLFRGTVDFQGAPGGTTSGQVETGVLSNVDLAQLEGSLGQTLKIGRAHV